MIEAVMSICAVLGVVLIFLIGIIIGGVVLVKGIISIVKSILK